MLQKNQNVELVIDGLTSEGLGVGRWDGQPVFVKDTVPGDRIRALIIKVKKNYAYGRLMEVLEPSKDRVVPRCPEARACGGCQLQMMSYEAQLKVKRDIVKNALIRIGGFDEKMLDVKPVAGADDPWNYRNKAQYPVRMGKDGRIIAGFFAGHTHQVIAASECAIGQPSDREILSCILSWMEERNIPPYDEISGKGLVRHVMIRTGGVSGEKMAVVVVNGKKLPYENELAQRLMKISGMTGVVLDINTSSGNAILGRSGRTLAGRDYIEDCIEDIRYKISYRSFYQVNPAQTVKLYRTALEFAGLTGNETVWDVYCGIGTISLFLARKAKWVYGVEIVPEAIEDAKYNAAVNNLQNTRFYTGKAEEVLPRLRETEGIRADVIVVDPPRKGCEARVLQTMTAMEPDKIVYVSCDPATLARDLKYLRENGYELKKVQPVEMFCQTCHIETVCLLGRRKPDDTIKVSVNMDDYYQIRDAEEAEKNPS